MQRDDMVRFSVKNCFHRQKVMYFYEKYFLGVEISVGPPNLPQIEKIQNVTKFCSKLSNYFFFENNPKNKGLCRETIWCVFLSKIVFTDKK